MFGNPQIVQIVQFLSEIGIPVRAGELPPETFLPGIFIENGGLVIDEARLTYPGDLLHEAGHLAVMSPQERGGANATMSDNGGFEMAAVAWSYAAALHIGLDPVVVFHEGGYRGGSQAILENFGAGRYFGVPVLEWMEMTVGAKPGMEPPVAAYPKMLRWLRT